MALSYKLLRVTPIGIDGKSAFIVIEDDVAEEYRLVEKTGIPARYTVSMINTWLSLNFNVDLEFSLGRILTGSELEFWLLLWRKDAALDDIADFKDDINADLGNVQTADIAGLRNILESIMLRQRYLFNVELNEIPIIIRLIKLRAAQETGENGT